MSTITILLRRSHCHLRHKGLLGLSNKLSSIMAEANRQIHDKAFINGEWVSANTTFDVFNPATDELLARVPDMSEIETETAIKHAHVAFQSWKLVTSKERSKLMKKWHSLIMENQQELAKIMTLENGKPLKESMAEINYGADYIEFYAEEAKRIHGEIIDSPQSTKKIFLMRQPIGVVGMLTPWNFPNAMIARKVAAAIACGCTCVVKPAEDTPLSALHLAALSKEAGIPPGVINIVTSSRRNTPSVGLALCSSPLVSGISFTGSTAVGKLLYKQSSSTMKRTSFELGGNAPFIVFESADLDRAVEGLLISKFRNSGQTCVSTNRVFVHESIMDKFVEKVKDAMAGFVVGNGMDSNTNIGPLINHAQFEKVTSMVKDAIAKGANVLLGGGPHSLGKTFYQPTLLTGLNEKMLCYNEEIFGPVVSIKSFKTEEEVMKAANSTRSGLAGYFYSSDVKQIFRVGQTLETGMVGINEGIISAAEAAFGGIKESGFGREGSSHGLDEYTYVKYLCMGNLS